MSHFSQYIPEHELSEIIQEAGMMPLVFSEDDVQYNIQKFLQKQTPVLWITGMSGGGKSWSAKEFSKETGADILHTDSLDSIALSVVRREDPPPYVHKVKLYKWFYNALTKQYAKKQGFDGNGFEYKAVLQDVVTLIQDMRTKYSNQKQLIIEGIRIPEMVDVCPSLIQENDAVLIKGTSLITSIRRRYTRDQEKGWFINTFSDIPAYMKSYYLWYKQQNQFREKITPNTESVSIEEK